MADDATHAQSALQLVTDGSIHGYEAHRKLIRGDGVVIERHVCVRAIEQTLRRLAFVVFMPERRGEVANDDGAELEQQL